MEINSKTAMGSLVVTATTMAGDVLHVECKLTLLNKSIDDKKALRDSVLK